MNLKNLSKVADSATIIGAKKRVNDAKYKTFKKKLKDDLENSETTSEAVDAAVAALEDQEPAIVVQAVTEILSDVIDAIDTAHIEEAPEDIEDSKKVRDALRKKRIAKIRAQRKARK